jgi:hypothetical protein
VLALLAAVIVPTVVTEVCVYANDRLTPNVYLTTQIGKVIATICIIGIFIASHGGLKWNDGWMIFLGIFAYE